MINYFHIFIITCATVLLQFHSIQFWSDLVGSITGWAWSITLEISVLWLWFQGRLFFLSVSASFLLLAGPLFQIVAPVLNAADVHVINERVRVEHVVNARQSISILQDSLRTVLRNSENRAGWSPDITRISAELQTERVLLNQLLSNEQPVYAGVGWLKTGLQALTLLVIWFVSVCAIRQLSRSMKPDESVEQLIESNPFYSENVVLNDDSLVQRLASFINDSIEESGKSQNAWSDYYSLSRKSVSQIRNHDRLLSSNKETVSERMVISIANVMGIK